VIRGNDMKTLCVVFLCAVLFLVGCHFAKDCDREVRRLYPDAEIFTVNGANDVPEEVMVYTVNGKIVVCEFAGDSISVYHETTQEPLMLR